VGAQNHGSGIISLTAGLPENSSVVILDGIVSLFPLTRGQACIFVILQAFFTRTFCFDFRKISPAN
jgi:hypothetical protein